uniref:Indoleamine 2,3-dioxygenase 2 n=1 Tax=Pyxicephalus adspersus TaxID=30357 RepID=A0AAV3B9G1_PYXAD|nr:TPA: hypothetical protein GDO54_007866 [Pyxicephalus adspersus]
MPELDIKQLKGHRQQRLARTVLSHLVMGYVWQNGESGGVKVLPRVLAVPYHQLSEALGLPPIMLHADFVLANWKKKDPLGNLSTIVSVPGGDSLQGFVLVTLLVEVAAVPAAKAIIQAVKSVESGDQQTLIVALQDMERSINQMSEAMHLMYGYWKDNPNMPEGLIYEGISEEPLQVSGVSATQSTIYHALDELFGIQHKPESVDFLLRMRHYMLPAHRNFIRWVQEAPKLPEYILHSKDPALLFIFNQCISALTELRSLHIRIVSKYVTTAGIRARAKKHQEANQSQEQQEKGTGGSNFMSFLKIVRDTCKEGMLRDSTPGDH